MCDFRYVRCELEPHSYSQKPKHFAYTDVPFSAIKLIGALNALKIHFKSHSALR